MSRANPANALTSEQRQLIIDRIGQGISHREIAREVGCSNSTVSAVRRANARAIAEARRASGEGLAEDVHKTIGALTMTIADATERASRLKDVADTAAALKDIAPAARALAELVKNAPKLAPTGAGRSGSTVAIGTPGPGPNVAVPPPQFRIV